MTPRILSIVIPTYNRVDLLALLLSDIGKVLARQPGKVQVVVCDNQSTDGTAALIDAFRATWPEDCKHVVRSVNLGMEGNIACAMIEGDGQYVWMLSDHQTLCVDTVCEVVARLDSLEFDIAHAKVAQWSPALPSRDVVTAWSAIPPANRGALLFSLGNLSTLMFRREMALNSTRAIFRACVWGYPHLGVLSRIGESTRVVEFDSMSSLPQGPGGSKLTHDYDKVSVRYRSNIECVELQARNGGFSFGRSGFFTPEYRQAFRVDVLNLLRLPDLSRRQAWRKLVPLVAANPWALKAVACFVLLGVVVMPASVRARLASGAHALIRRRPGT